MIGWIVIGVTLIAAVNFTYLCIRAGSTVVRAVETEGYHWTFEHTGYGQMMGAVGCFWFSLAVFSWGLLLLFLFLKGVPVIS